MAKKYMDTIAGAFLLIISIFMFTQSFFVRRLTVSRIGAGFVPQLVFGLLAILSILLIIESLSKTNVNKSSSEIKVMPSSKYTVIATLIIIAIYIALLEKVGFVIMTSFYLFVQFFILARKDQRKIRMFAIISVITSTSIYYIFLKLFQLMLPAGFLG